MISRRNMVAGSTMAALTLSSEAVAAPAARLLSPGSATPVLAGTGPRLFIREWGQGRTIVFTHSLGLSSETWHLQMLHLASKGFRCLAYDRRGHGRSDVPPGGYDLDTLADDLAGVINAGGTGQVALVGHSTGCGEILRYLARHGSARVSRIALLGTTTPCLLASASNGAGLPPSAVRALEEAWAADFPKWVETNKRPFFTPDTSVPMMDWLARQMLSTPLPVLLTCNRAMVEADHRPGLARVDRPVLLLHGDKDVSAPIDLTARPTAAGIREAQLIVYPGAAHGLFTTHAGFVNRDLEAFLTPS